MTTLKMDPLQAAVQNADAGDFLRALIGYAAQRLMDLEVEAVTGAGYGERSPERQTRRNGYRDRQWQTRAGAVDDMVQAMGGTFSSFARDPAAPPFHIRHLSEVIVWTDPATGVDTPSLQAASRATIEKVEK